MHILLAQKTGGSVEINAFSVSQWKDFQSAFLGLVKVQGSMEE